MSGDKRKAKRAPLDVYVNKYMGGVPYMARTEDISAEGVGLSRLLEPEHGTQRVGLQFQLPGPEEVIYAEGEVVREWVEVGNPEARSNVRFTLLTERHRRLIDDYITEQAH